MSKYQLLPPLSTAEYEALREDIAVAGVLLPIDVDEHGEILDGHHRKQACDELGIECPTRTVDVPEFAKKDYALTVNLARRHLDRAQRRQLVWNSLKDASHLSDRLHARRCGVSPTTVADVRKDMEAADLVSKLDTRTDKRGREQPATKAAAAATSPAADEASSSSTSVGDASAGSGDVASVAGPGNPSTAAGHDTEPADGDDRSSADASPAAGPGASSLDGEADRPGPAVTPTDHAGDAAQDAPVEGPDDVQGDETDPSTPLQEDGSVDGREQQDPAGVSGPAAPGPVELLDELAEKFEAFDVEVLAPLMTSAELAAMRAALKQLTFTVDLFGTWHERTKS